MTDIEGSTFQRDPETQRALEEALWRTSLKAFGPLYDLKLSQISDRNPEPYEQRSDRAIEATLAQLGIDLNSVIAEARDEAWASKHLTPSARHALDRVTQEAESNSSNNS